MLHKIRNHLYLALVFTILSLAQQYGFYALKGFPIVWLSFGKYLGVLLTFFIFTFTPGPKLRLFILSYLLILNFFQMAHLSFFGTQVLPSEIYLFFTEFKEITGTVGNEFSHVLIPFLFTLIPMAIGFFFVKKLKETYALKTVPVLIALYFLYNPIRTSVTGNTWGRQPSTKELAVMNMYLSMSYFAGKILPQKMMAKQTAGAENESLKLRIDEFEATDWDNIIVILGESLTPHHMSLFGYERQTTPFLDSLKSDPKFFSTIGLSSGVSTDISVAFLLNMGYGDAGGLKAAKGDNCLFKLAKRGDYSTHFLSTQSAEQLRYIAPYLCTAYLDDYRNLENISPSTLNHQAAIDREVLPKLDDLLVTNSKKFIMLHQRGSHSPWSLRYTAEAAKFKSEGADQRISDYDNSVVEFDLFWKEFAAIMSKKKSKNLVIYLSDHGESVGENNRYGHGFLQPHAFEIPVLIMAFNQDLPAKTKDLPKFLPQYNVSLYLAQQIGWKTSQSPFEKPKDFVIYGNDIDGFAGKANITFDEKSYKFKVVH